MPTQQDKEGATANGAGGRYEAETRAVEAETLATGEHAPFASSQPQSFAARVSARGWSVAAGACLLVALGLLLSGHADAAFVAATLGVVAWFWDQRNRLRARGIESGRRFRRAAEDEDEEIEDEEGAVRDEN
ncbi:MAG TPA: hypothetical protein VJT82_10470 [Pyrinomonadaceae bacterium]|nr:hypothetical protein [Pyrinomonadaceae bacterium]